MEGKTPMFKQYYEIKKKYSDALLFYRLGDFYEMFGDDAKKASQILGLALTARDGGKNIKIPMCGVPFHSADNYISKLINAGLKVAICEQTEDPKVAKGIVKRDVIRVLTPGMLIDNKMLPDDHNYIASVSREGDKAGIAIADASTGIFLANDVHSLDVSLNEMERYHPVEIVYNENDSFLYDALLNKGFSEKVRLSGHYLHAFHQEEAEEKLKDHFNVNSLSSFGYESKKTQGLSMAAAGALLDYIYAMQKSKPLNITGLIFYRIDDRMILDRATRRNLELEESLYGGDDGLSLFKVLDHTCTASGRRLLKNWLEHPLTNMLAIQERLNATEELYQKHEMREQFQVLLKSIYDMERIVSRISYRTANAKDLLSLQQSLSQLPQFAALLMKLETPTLKKLSNDFDDLTDVCLAINKAIHPDAPFSLREGQLIASGWHEEVDELRKLMDEGESWLEEFEQKEKEKTGIKTLKIGYNRVFGYYIDVTKSQLNKIPDHYMRKQTLANSERYITEELKEMERKVIGANERLKSLEYELFVSFREDLLKEVNRILKTSRILAIIDVHSGLADCAIVNEYCKPEIAEEKINIVGLRHPMVELSLRDKAFVPNNADFNKTDRRFMILTGPNMSGKSTYCRSLAIASIMMQMGSFIPAERAKMKVVDRVFARIGANDHLSSGQSTFMVEMNEMANILNHATEESLIVLDEVGRGTSTYDGLSIAYAITHYINEQIRGCTIFATHYHELTQLDSEDGVFNASVAVEDDGQNIVFMHTIISGAADKSYGIHVAKMAGIPTRVVAMANEVLAVLEDKKKDQEININKDELEWRKKIEKQVKFLEQIADKSITNLSIGDAINELIALKDEAEALLER